MKKRNLQNLTLNKKSISNMSVHNPIGGRDSNNRICFSQQRPTICYWEAGCESVRPTLCC